MGVDVGGFGPERRSADVRRAMLRRCRGTEESVLLLYAGRLSPEKNVGLLVETMQALGRHGDRDYRMAVIGDGPLAPWLRAHARGPLGGRMSVCATLDRATLASYCASADVFVHPNPREPFGIGPLEAMASGVPVVVPETGGVIEYANRGNAWLAAPTADAFADAVQSAALGDAPRVAAARTTAMAFNWTRTTRQYFSAYDEIRRRHLLSSDRSALTPRPLGNARRVTHV
jgi:alpha-1,6-mannosyltransferase